MCDLPTLIAHHCSRLYCVVVPARSPDDTLSSWFGVVGPPEPCKTTRSDFLLCDSIAGSGSHDYGNREEADCRRMPCEVFVLGGQPPSWAHTVAEKCHAESHSQIAQYPARFRAQGK